MVFERLDYMFESISKNVNDCPHCGGLSHFISYDVISYHVKCSGCGCSGPVVKLPSYWSKGDKRLEYRMFRMAVLPWNKKFTGRIIHTNGPLRKRTNL